MEQRIKCAGCPGRKPENDLRKLMKDIDEFEKQYRQDLQNAAVISDMPAGLLEQFEFESWISRSTDGKKELFLVRRLADSARGLLRVTNNYPQEDAFWEAELLSSLNHPAIPKVYGAFEKGEKRYVIREYFEGRSLYETVKQNGIMSSEEIYQVILSLCGILSYLHGLNPPVIHRDIKPQNIILDTNGQIRLIDFGISRIHKPGQKQDTSVVLTGAYAPPEQFGYDQTSPLTDIYSSGILMLFLATGMTEKNAVEDQIKDRDLVRLIEKCIAFDPKKRYQRIQEVTKYISRISGRKKRRIKQLLAVCFLAAAVSSAFISYTAGFSAGEKAGYSEGHSAAFTENMAGALGIKPVPYDPAACTLPGNMVNKGFAVRGKDYIYYIGGTSIYEMSPDGSQVRIISEGTDARRLCYYDGMLYYSSRYGISKISPQTLQETEVIGVSADFMMFYDNYIYFLNPEDWHRLYRTDPDGRNTVKIHDSDQIYYLNIADGRMYYSDAADNYRIYSSRLDGSDKKMLSGSGDWLCIYEGVLYFYKASPDGALMRINTDGTNPEVLLSSFIQHTNVSSAGIYYLGGTEQELEWMSFDGRVRLKIVPYTCGVFNVAGEWIFYVNPADSDSLWRVRIDGTDNQRAEQ